MPDLVTECPFCRSELMINNAKVDMVLECPNCRRSSIISLALRPLASKKRTAEDIPEMSPVRSGAYAEIKKQRIIKTFLGLAVVALLAFLIYKYLTPTPEKLDGNQLYVMTQKRMNRDNAMGMAEIARHDFFPAAKDKKYFFYRGVSFDSISLHRSDNDEEYRGTVYFTRNRQRMQRPVLIDRRTSYTQYHFPFKYTENPQYLEEDGDLIFELAKEVKRNLKEWTYKTGKVAENGVLECVISKDGTEKKIRLKAEQVIGSDRIGRVWVEVLSD